MNWNYLVKICSKLDKTPCSAFKGVMNHSYNTYTCTYIYLRDGFDAFHKFDVCFPFDTVLIYKKKKST